MKYSPSCRRSSATASLLVLCRLNAPQRRDITCAYFTSFSSLLGLWCNQKHLCLLPSHSPVISLLFQNSPPECLPFSPNHFRANFCSDFISVALQHHRLRFTVLSLESCNLLFQLLSEIPPSEYFPFRHFYLSTIFSLVYPHGNTNIHVSSLLPSLQLAFISTPLYCFFFFASHGFASSLPT